MMIKRVAAIVVLIVVLAASAVLAATALDKDTLIAGTSAGYPPYESRNEKAELVGFDIELTETVAKKLGKNVEWLDMTFESLIPSLMVGKIDLAAASIAASEERAKRVNFSTPYEISSSAFVTKPDNPPKSVDDLTGKLVVVQMGTLQEKFVRDLGTVEVKTFQNNDDCVREVMVGRAAATLIDVPVAKKFVQAKDFAGKVTIAFTFKSRIPGADKAIAMPKNDPELTEAVSKIISEMEESGELEALRNKWFQD